VCSVPELPETIEPELRVSNGACVWFRCTLENHCPLEMGSTFEGFRWVEMSCAVNCFFFSFCWRLWISGPRWPGYTGRGPCGDKLCSCAFLYNSKPRFQWRWIMKDGDVFGGGECSGRGLCRQSLRGINLQRCQVGTSHRPIRLLDRYYLRSLEGFWKPVAHSMASTQDKVHFEAGISVPYNN
jgi:hypothetical protein